LQNTSNGHIKSNANNNENNRRCSETMTGAPLCAAAGSARHFIDQENDVSPLVVVVVVGVVARLELGGVWDTLFSWPI